MKSMRIMQLVSNLEIGGAQEMVRTLADFLVREGCQSVVCAFRDGPLRAEIERLGIPVEILPERRRSIIALPLFIYEMIQLHRALAALVKKYDVDIIQTHLLRSLDFLALSLRRNGRPQVFWTFHNALFDLREDHLARGKWLLKPKRASHHWLYTLGSRFVSGLVAVSEDVRDSILKAMPGIAPENIHVIVNRVDVFRYGNRQNREALRRNLGFVPSDHLMTVVATLKTQKGHSVLLSAMAEIAADYPQLRLLIVGDGSLRTELEARAKALQLDGRVHFLGERNDVPDLLAASDSFVLPSLWEGLPMALVEAMASALPVIATEVSGTRQVVVDGESGLLVLPGDHRRLALVMSEILANPQRAQELGAAARRRMEKHYSAKTQAREYLDLYEQAQSRGSGRLAVISGE